MHSGRYYSAVVTLCLCLSGCAAVGLLSYVARPDYPLFRSGDQVALAGLTETVSVVRRGDGFWRVEAKNEIEGMRVLGYLQARDRMAQLDLFRHLANGEVAALVGDRPFAGKRSIDADRLNRFLGFREGAGRLYAATDAGERRILDAFVEGINAWIEVGHLSFEHRLLGVDAVRPWSAEDSLAIYLMVMHGLGGNADREIRRLAIACSAGLDALERIWPTDLEHDVFALPKEDVSSQVFPVPPGVVPEVRAELAQLCGSEKRSARELDADAFASVANLLSSWSASNNWAVSGEHTASGFPVLSSDPHLPQMNPPMVWGFEFETDEYHAAGFTLPGLYRVVFGHNGSVAWGATTNHVDRQDLVLHKPRRESVEGIETDGYEVDGRFVPFERRTETFEVKGAGRVEETVRFTRDGPLLNDLSGDLGELLPLVALRTVPIGRGSDLVGAARLSRARTVEEFAIGIDLFDLGCSSWVAADASGSIAYRSPCLVPVRPGWRGTFPIPGWLTRYDWKGFVAKSELPASTNPERGWLATANNQIVPSNRVPTTYNNDVSAPNRFVRISDMLHRSFGKIDVAASAAIQLDKLDVSWSSARNGLQADLCQHGPEPAAELRKLLCDWDGTMDPASAGPTAYTHLTHALLDEAFADELSGGANGEVWRFVQSLVQFEVGVRRLWNLAPTAAVWDDVTTSVVEDRAAILDRGLEAADKSMRELYGDAPASWLWGTVRPFVLRHPFAPDAGIAGAILGRVLNSAPLAIGGGNETVFKNQFARSHRTKMRVEIGPIVRFSIDMGDPWAARYTLAGGQSGWPGSPYYANLLEDWSVGRDHPMTPPKNADDTAVRFVPIRN